MPEPSNQEIAAVFHEMAELLRLRGGEPHRARAFDRVGRVLENLPEPAPRMLRRGRLGSVAGIGEGTLHRVKQILRTGSCDDLRRLRAALPPGLGELLQLRGLGPRQVRTIYQRLGISNLEQLEAAARDGRLRTLPRFGVDTVHRILQSLEAYQARRGKAPLVEALATLDRLGEPIRSLADVEAVSPGGSCRRRRALIGDLDLLVAAADPVPVVEAFTTHPEVSGVLARRTDGASVRLRDGRQADLWVFPPECWGAGLHAFSGSKQHVVAVRTRAGRYGLHLSEHGIFDRDGRRLVATGRGEEEIFAAVGLPFIPPELRENLGEIEAAAEGRLPRLVEAGDLRGDLHLHTRDSDGSGTAQEMAEAASALGYEYLAVTDHSKSLAVAGGLDEARLAEQTRHLRALEDRLGSLHLLSGVEVDILPGGELDLDGATLRRLDWVVASVHDHFELSEEEMTGRLLRGLETGLVDCLGHLTGRRLDQRDPYPVDVERILEAARRLGVAVEVNGNPYRMDLDEVGCRQAREVGVPVTLVTDAHSPVHLARRDFALAVARRGWLEPRHVLNTQPVERIVEHPRYRLRRHGIAVPALPPHRRRGASEAGTAPARAPEELRDPLTRRPLPPALRERLDRFLRKGDDPELEAALAELGGNPVQRAFDLLAGEGSG